MLSKTLIIHNSLLNRAVSILNEPGESGFVDSGDDIFYDAHVDSSVSSESEPANLSSASSTPRVSDHEASRGVAPRSLIPGENHYQITISIVESGRILFDITGSLGYEEFMRREDVGELVELARALEPEAVFLYDQKDEDEIEDGDEDLFDLESTFLDFERSEVHMTTVSFEETVTEMIKRIESGFNNSDTTTPNWRSLVSRLKTFKNE